jgi:hypothetical protein
VLSELNMSDYDFHLNEEEVLPTDSISQFSQGALLQNNASSNYRFTVINFCKVIVNDPQCLAALEPFTTKVHIICLVTDSLIASKRNEVELSA